MKEILPPPKKATKTKILFSSAFFLFNFKNYRAAIQNGFRTCWTGYLNYKNFIRFIILNMEKRVPS